MGIAGRRRAGAARPRGGDLRVGRRLGDEPDGGGAPAPSVPGHPSHVPGDREQVVHLAQHRQERGGRDLPQARCLIAQRGDRTRRRARAPGELRSIRRRRISSRKDDARRGPRQLGYEPADGRVQGAPASARRARRGARRADPREETALTAVGGHRRADRGARAHRRDDRRRCGPFLVPARRGARPGGRGDERRDRRHPRGGHAGDGRSRASSNARRRSRSRSATTSTPRSSGPTRNAAHPCRSA